MPRVNCAICSNEITNPDFKYVWYQEGFESIDIGPYCPDCFVKIKICSGCQHPFTQDQVTHTGRGRHYCDACKDTLEICSQCNQEESIHKIIDGKKWCVNCFTTHFFTCDCCGEIKNKDTNSWSDLEIARKRGLFKKYPSICKGCYSQVESRYKAYKVNECKHCGSVYSVGKGSHDKYCDMCWDSFKTCGECGLKHPTVKKYSKGAEAGSTALCKRCLTTKYHKCSFCNGFVKESSTISGIKSTHHLCNYCVHNNVEECSSCLKIGTLSDGVCRECHNTYYGNKCFCGQIRDFESNCRVCEDTRVYNYSTKPRLVYHNTKKDIREKEDLYFGFENEMTFNSGANSHLQHIYKNYDPTVLLAKSDGSIQGSGYELVTQPMTLRYFHKMDLAPIFAGDNMEHTSCGLHIHVGREAFHGSLHILKVSKLIQEFPEFVDEIAGRSAGSYNTNFSDKVSKVVKDEKKGQLHEARSSRINLTGRHTIEFRLFLGCNTEYKLRYRVEFLIALIRWSEMVGISEVTPQNYRKYVMENNKVYPNLYRFLND